MIEDLEDWLIKGVRVVWGTMFPDHLVDEGGGNTTPGNVGDRVVPADTKDTPRLPYVTVDVIAGDIPYGFASRLEECDPEDEAVVLESMYGGVRASISLQAHGTKAIAWLRQLRATLHRSDLTEAATGYGFSLRSLTGVTPLDAVLGAGRERRAVLDLEAMYALKSAARAMMAARRIEGSLTVGPDPASGDAVKVLLDLDLP